jgi:hypothetical protein
LTSDNCCSQCILLMCVAPCIFIDNYNQCMLITWYVAIFWLLLLICVVSFVCTYKTFIMLCNLYLHMRNQKYVTNKLASD